MRTMPAPGGAADEGGTVELTFSVWGDPENWPSQAIADDFVTQNPGIEVTVNVSTGTRIGTSCDATSAAGTPPDVFAMDAPLYPDYQSRGTCSSCSRSSTGTASTWKATTRSRCSAMTRLTATTVCRDVQPSVLYYNKDMFDAASASPIPTTRGPGKTWWKRARR
ncbi:MAG: hypothetical protein R2838_00270 [Caldilineaceae bacterium]